MSNTANGRPPADDSFLTALLWLEREIAEIDSRLDQLEADLHRALDSLLVDERSVEYR